MRRAAPIRLVGLLGMTAWLCIDGCALDVEGQGEPLDSHDAAVVLPEAQAEDVLGPEADVGPGQDSDPPEVACFPPNKVCKGECVTSDDPKYGCRSNTCEPCPEMANATVDCVNEACTLTACTEPFEDCNGSNLDGCEVNIHSVEDCGTCGIACAMGNAEVTCDSGVCEFVKCLDGWADCDALVEGCETPLRTLENCRSCGDVCSIPGAVTTCATGECLISDCEVAFTADCNQNPDDGCETPIDTPQNCGGCNVECRREHAQPSCWQGVCSIGQCEYPWLDCDNTDATGCETNPHSSVAHCGGCDQPCSQQHVQTTFCNNGKCVPACADGYANCDPQPLPGGEDDGCETDINNDPNNCGGCGTVCSFPHGVPACEQGACVLGGCEPGWANCDNNPANGCEVDLRGSPNHCGACGNTCTFDHATGVCNNGTCELGSCHANWGNCDNNPANGCEANLRTSVNHCGGCGSACSTDHVNTRTCNNGLCQPSCDSGYGDCNGPQPGSIDDGCEVALHTDAQNCGQCGKACSTSHASSTQCIAGACHPTCEANYGDCNGPRPGATDDGCEVNLATNTSHCGGCNFRCETTNVQTPVCQAGQCRPVCHAGFDDCDGPHAGNVDNGCEVNTNTSVAHCGSCNAPCAGDHVQSRRCITGRCEPVCQAGWGDCNGPTPGANDDGCEADLLGNPDHCGGCNYVCETAHVSQRACTAGKCTPQCQAGWGDCDPPVAGNTDNGCEVNLANNVNHCGGCGAACSTFNTLARHCENSICRPVCNEGFGDCSAVTNGFGDDGCETNTFTNVEHCGGCGQPCSGTNVDVRVCSGGACSPQCSDGYDDCDGPHAGNVDNGCEADLESLATCGSCSNQCSASHVVNGDCDNGQCMGDCANGWADCNNNLQADGCEINTNTNAQHCGACGVVCSNRNVTAPTCAGGTCTGACAAGFNDCNGDRQSDGCECPNSFSCTGGACRCANNPDCNAGSPGTCGSDGRCECNGTLCSVGQRCKDNKCTD